MQKSLLSFFIIFFSLAFLLPTSPVRADIQAAAPDLLLANVYRQQVDVRDYWVSEKLDGVRAYWNGKQLVSRRGNVFHAPEWFHAQIPPVPLDGELWMGRGTFAVLSGAVRRQVPDDEQWRQIRFMVFDMPELDAPFDERLRQMRQLLPEDAIAPVALIEQYKVADHQELQLRLEEVVAGGGEGLMLHRADSLYRDGRSDDLLKVKTYQDAEAVVVAHLPGEGKYKGMMGALLVELPNKRRFKIGTGFSDAERSDPPPVGSLITYKYFGETSSGLPRFASFMRIRDSH